MGWWPPEQSTNLEGRGKETKKTGSVKRGSMGEDRTEETNIRSRSRGEKIRFSCSRSAA